MAQKRARCALWLRVSTSEQDAGNQLPELEQFATHHGYGIVETYRLADSAWNGGSDGYKATLQRALADAHAGRFEVLAVWALDRLTRGGAEDVLRLVRLFRERGVTLVSVREPWLSTSPEIADVLVSFAGWVAQQESQRRSERIKAGLARRKAEGKPIGRQVGAKDKRARRKSGYYERWEREKAV